MRGSTKLKKSGRVWRLPAGRRALTVRAVCKAFEDAYGLPRFGNPADPLDDLIYIILSNKTSGAMSASIYHQLKAKAPTWEHVVAHGPRWLERVIRQGGLSHVKSRQIIGALRRIRSEFGRCDLRPLRGQPPDSIEAFLTALPGVSEKVAKCVMLYALDCEVLPVDTHVYRITSRLGWTSRRRADQTHGELETLVPPKLRHAFHVGSVAHGRGICRATAPLCDECCIRKYCTFGRARHAR